MRARIGDAATIAALVVGGFVLGAGVPAAADSSSAATATPGSAPPASSSGGQGLENTLYDALLEARKARCATALCWGSDYEWALEPLVELPVGKTFAVSGAANSLGAFINSHDFTATFAAGLRFWLAWDVASVAVYFSQPLNTGDASIHVPNSPVNQPVSNIRRPIPGFALGILGDLMWIGLDYQELVNGDGGARDPNYPPNGKIAKSWSLTIGLAPGTGLRTGVATGLKSTSGQSPAVPPSASAAASAPSASASALVAPPPPPAPSAEVPAHPVPAAPPTMDLTPTEPH